jgi:hypothetical protein
MKALFDSLSNGEITLIASILSALIAAVVSVLTTRYTLRHGPNYEKEIKGIRETIGELAAAQNRLVEQQTEQATEDRRRFETAEKKAEQSRWKPEITLLSVVDGNQQANKLVLKSIRSFCLLEVSLISSSGAKIFEYPMNKPVGCSTGFGVLESGNGAEYVGEYPFRAQQTIVSNTCFYKLSC